MEEERGRAGRREGGREREGGKEGGRTTELTGGVLAKEATIGLRNERWRWGNSLRHCRSNRSIWTALPFSSNVKTLRERIII